MNIAEVLDYEKDATVTNVVAKMDRIGEDKSNDTEGKYQLGRLKDNTGEIWFILTGGGLDRDTKKADEVTINKAKVEIDSRGKKRLRFSKTDVVVGGAPAATAAPKEEGKLATTAATQTTSREALPVNKLVARASSLVAQTYVEVEKALDGHGVSSEVVAALTATAVAPVLTVLLDTK